MTCPGTCAADVGEDGKLLSAGERARLALARVLVADRPWVFMDEPTAHLDQLTELIIADTILELGRTSGVVVVAHDEAMLALGDQLLVLESPPSAMPVAAAAAPARRPIQRAVPAVSEEEGGSDPQPPATFWSSTVLAALASASGVALTATAGWLIVQASTRPPVLTLLVAIVAVRTFGLARPVLRYVERLRSHDAALRLLAPRRVDVYDALVPLVPGRLGKQRGDVLTSVVDDVDSVVDNELRVKLPVRSYALVWLLAVVATGALLPSAGLVIAAVCGGSAVVAFAVARTGAARAEVASIGLRAEISSAVVETLELSSELIMWQRIEAAAAAVGRASDRMGTAVRRAGSWAAAARAWLVVTTGAAIALVGVLAAAAFRAGDVSAPTAALLVLTPLALLDVALPGLRCRRPLQRGHAPPRTAWTHWKGPRQRCETHLRVSKRGVRSSYCPRSRQAGDQSLRCADSRWR